MLRGRTFGGSIAKGAVIEAGKSLTLNMERSDGLKNLAYDFHFEIQHDNAAAITTDAYKFVKNFLKNLKFQTGAGENQFDLTPTEFMINQLIEEGRLRYNIVTASGNDKVSTVMLRWNFTLPKEYENPLDTVFHSDNTKYNYVQVKFEPQKTFDSITNLTIDSINLSITEHFKENPTPKTIQTAKGVKAMPALNKIIKVKDLSYNSDTSSEIVELPKNTSILGIFAFVVDQNGDLVSDAINNMALKNGNEYFKDFTFTELNEDNRDKFLKTWSNALWNDVCYMDIAKGQLSEALPTNDLKHSNTVLSFDLTAVGATNILKVMYLTVEDA